MRNKIFGYLALFCAFTIAVLWVFQVVFLDSFYRSIMTRKLEATAEVISGAYSKLSPEDFSAKVYDFAENTGFCISVYEIKDGVGKCTVSAHIKNTCLIHNAVGEKTLNELYSGAAQSGGAYIRTYSMSPSGDADSGEDGVMVLARTKETDGGALMVLVNAEVLPVAAITSTLRSQLVWITAILLAASALLAVFISRRLSRPVSEINEEAKILASGSYNVNFTGGGYRETEELADTLNYAASELSKVDRMQKELIANISHDLRTPLTMISGYSEVMRDIPGEMTPENMQIIIDETRRLTSLVNDVLDLSRLTSGQTEPKNEVFSLTGLVREAMDRYAHLKESEGYTITFEADGEAYVFADSTRISQVLYNLVNNAINYTGEDKKITVTQSISGNNVRISVADTGEGIPEDKLELIWERYYKASEYHRRGTVGSGLGLSIVKQILEGYGAPFGVTSRVGEGSVFWFELPLWTDGQAGGGNTPEGQASGNQESGGQASGGQASGGQASGGLLPDGAAASDADVRGTGTVNPVSASPTTSSHGAESPTAAIPFTASHGTESADAATPDTASSVTASHGTESATSASPVTASADAATPDTASRDGGKS